MSILIWCIIGFIAGIINILLNYFIDKDDIVIRDVGIMLLSIVLGGVAGVMCILVIIIRIFDDGGDKIIFKAKK